MVYSLQSLSICKWNRGFFQYIFHGAHLRAIKFEAALIVSKLQGPQVREFSFAEEEMEVFDPVSVEEYKGLIGKLEGVFVDVEWLKQEELNTKN